jgi:hypothetical protein
MFRLASFVQHGLQLTTRSSVFDSTCMLRI